MRATVAGGLSWVGGRLSALGAGLGGVSAATGRAGSEVGSERRRIVITGGTRSGKSVAAERRLLPHDRVTYVATSLPRPGDASWERRVALHRDRRPDSWTTVETLEVAALLEHPPGPLLIDCASLWLGAWLESPDRRRHVDELVDAWSRTDAYVVLVTSEVGSGVHAATELGREYADELGRLNARLATAADEAWLVVAGQELRLK